MIIRVSVLKKGSVLTKDGKKMSSIQEIIYDQDHGKILGFLTSKKSLMSDAKLILFSDAKEINVSTLLVETERVEKKATELGEHISKLSEDETSYLSKGKVIGEDAADFGSVSDVFFDSSSGRIIGFEVSQGPIKDIKSGKKTMKIDSIISVGKDAIIVNPKVARKKTQNYKNSEVQNAIGKYVSKNIITSNDELLVKQGDIVTHKMIDVATQLGLADEILHNLSDKPLTSYQVIVK